MPKIHKPTWIYFYTVGATNFYNPIGKTFLREGYSRSDAQTLVDYLNSR